MQVLSEVSQARCDEIKDFLKFTSRIERRVLFDGAVARVPDFVETKYISDEEKTLQASHVEHASGPVSDIGFYFGRDLLLRGRGFAFVGKELLAFPDLVPSYVRYYVDTGSLEELDADPHRRVRYVEGPVLVLTSESYPVYGHWILDILPRAWLFLNRFGPTDPELKIILPSDVPDFGKTILCDLFGLNLDKFAYFDWRAEDVLLERAIIPSLLHNSQIYHPAMNGFVRFVRDRFGVRAEARADARLFVSRSRFNSKSASFRREMENEALLASHLNDRGFEVVFPEDLNWEEQIRKFATAGLVVGESGSGLHNTLFGPEGGAVVCLRAANQVQAAIASLRRQRLTYIQPAIEARGEGKTTYSIDVERTLAVIEAMSERGTPLCREA
ncbi:MAG TPA: glycosyltransferase family 61 protein [Methylocystis sp.]|nr:glycosyltransferase family 61 protein [Methylocystis sp.]